MRNSNVFTLENSGFNEFLCAAVGTEPNGMTLNLLSVFARLGDDPWREAGRLAIMPKGAAIDSLARTIAGMPTSVWPLPAATAIATRLVALLPKRGLRRVARMSSQATRFARIAKIGLVLVATAVAVSYMLGQGTTGGAPRADGGEPAASVVANPLAPPAGPARH
jgi:hypothetical protein